MSEDRRQILQLLAGTGSVSTNCRLAAMRFRRALMVG